jgi:polyhydroxyalkanoate synthesis regulator phasin
VPRPPVLERPKIVPIVFEERLYLELRKIASSRGISVSSLIREIVMKYLGSTSSAQADDPPAPSAADPPQSVDLVVKMDIEELEEEVGEVEKTVKKIEEQLEKSSKLPRNILEFWLKNDRVKLQEALVRAENKLKKLRQKYYSVKRKTRNNSEVEALASRMYTLKSRIKQLEARLK